MYYIDIEHRNTHEQYIEIFTDRVAFLTYLTSLLRDLLFAELGPDVDDMSIEELEQRYNEHLNIGLPPHNVHVYYLHTMLNPVHMPTYRIR